MWRVGQKLIRETSPELGIGIVKNIEGRFIDVFFPDSDTELRLTPEAGGIKAVEIKQGDEVRLPSGEITSVRGVMGGVAVLANGKRARVGELWPYIPVQTPVDRLAASYVDPMIEVLNRLDGQRLMNYRRRGEVASLIGGRVELFGHQIDTASRAIEDERVRWLLADEVGLGKTVVACMITSALIRMGRVEKAIIVVPDTLSVQWLGELYRKFHQIFVHIDERRLMHVQTDFGLDANPFGVHRLAIVSAELLSSRPGLLAQLAAEPPELIVVDEAHQTFDDEIGDVLLPVVAGTEHALLLTATPFQMGEDGFAKLVDALGLDHQRGDGHVVRRVSAVTRGELVAMAERRPHAVDVEHAGNLDGKDPRVKWLVEYVQQWHEDGEKALVFVNSADAAKKLTDTLTRKLQRRVFTFHEEMGTKARDIELAQFRISSSCVLVSSGAGGEGRNFQFCDHMVHVELPSDPVVLEQRIGRMDRIGRTDDIPIHYFRVPGDPLAEAYERVGIFADASIGSSPAMVHLREALADEHLDPENLDELVASVQAQLEREAGSWSFPDSHRREDAEAALARIPEDLDEMLQRFCHDAAEHVGLDVVEKEGEHTYYFEYGSNVEVDAIPGLHEGARFLGTFDRRTAIENEALDFFANGHPLVEGLIAELEDSPRGRVGAVRLPRKRSENLHGLYLLLIEGRETVTSARIVPLMHASGVDLAAIDMNAEAHALYEELDLAIELDKGRVKALMGRVSNQPVLNELDASEVMQAILVVIMD